MPLRSSQFSQGILALQWRALPYYYQYKLLLIAQAAAVVSPITAVDHRDFQYVSPLPEAEMEGVLNADGVTRRRKITIRLARYWDCLPADAQQRWAIENPASVENGDPQSALFRHSAVPDPDVIYQVVITMPSRNVEVLAEYRWDATSVSGYLAQKLEGPFQGDAVRMIPPTDGPGVGARFFGLETLLTRVAGADADNGDVFEAQVERQGFALGRVRPESRSRSPRSRSPHVCSGSPAIYRPRRSRR